MEKLFIILKLEKKIFFFTAPPTTFGHPSYANPYYPPPPSHQTQSNLADPQAHPAIAEQQSHRPPQPPSQPSSVNSFEQFDNAKSTPPHDRASPSSYQSPPTEEEPAVGGTSEFSGLVSYFSSQQDDLET